MIDIALRIIEWIRNSPDPEEAERTVLDLIEQINEDSTR